jgi:hypothetical protein
MDSVLLSGALSVTNMHEEACELQPSSCMHVLLLYVFCFLTLQKLYNVLQPVPNGYHSE